MQLKNLKTKFLGRNTIYYKEIDSTQNQIWENINKIPNGTLIIADIQTSGKGTHGRIWHTDETNNIAFSFLIKLSCSLKDLDGITKEIAETIVDILNKKYKITLQIKEPNDIVIGNKKVGGILTETKVMLEEVKFLVIGIGLNTSKENFTDDIKNIATSIKKEFGVDVDRLEFITEFCNAFEEKIIRRFKVTL